jgi:ribosomal protein S18 acetylase RimI-like enzyme
MEPQIPAADDGALRNSLNDLLYDFNVEATGIADGKELAFEFRDDAGELLAGLSGWTWGATAYVDVVWVRRDHRGQGMGSALLDAAEEEGARRGCHQVVLSTHSFQAPELYSRRGYEEYGRITDYPKGHDQVHLVKRLP